MKTKVFYLSLIMGMIALNSLAQTIRQTERHQRVRIRQGVRSGELTRAEALNLRNDQREIRQDVRAARADDGRIDRQERREIKQEQQQASRKIFRKKHNLRTRN